eukprot:UC4_evm1s625
MEVACSGSGRIKGYFARLVVALCDDSGDWIGNDSTRKRVKRALDLGALEALLNFIENIEHDSAPPEDLDDNRRSDSETEGALAWCLQALLAIDIATDATSEMELSARLAVVLRNMLSILDDETAAIAATLSARLSMRSSEFSDALLGEKETGKLVCSTLVDLIEDSCIFHVPAGLAIAAVSHNEMHCTNMLRVGLGDVIPALLTSPTTLVSMVGAYIVFKIVTYGVGNILMKGQHKYKSKQFALICIPGLTSLLESSSGKVCALSCLAIDAMLKCPEMSRLVLNQVDRGTINLKNILSLLCYKNYRYDILFIGGFAGIVRSLAKSESGIKLLECDIGSHLAPKLMLFLIEAVNNLNKSTAVYSYIIEMEPISTWIDTSILFNNILEAILALVSIASFKSTSINAALQHNFEWIIPSLNYSMCSHRQFIAGNITLNLILDGEVNNVNGLLDATESAMAILRDEAAPVKSGGMAAKLLAALMKIPAVVCEIPLCNLNEFRHVLITMFQEYKAVGVVMAAIRALYCGSYDNKQEAEATVLISGLEEICQNFKASVEDKISALQTLDVIVGTFKNKPDMGKMNERIAKSYLLSHCNISRLDYYKLREQAYLSLVAAIERGSENIFGKDTNHLIKKVIYDLIVGDTPELATAASQFFKRVFKPHYCSIIAKILRKTGLAPLYIRKVASLSNMDSDSKLRINFHVALKGLNVLSTGNAHVARVLVDSGIHALAFLISENSYNQIFLSILMNATRSDYCCQKLGESEDLIHKLVQHLREPRTNDENIISCVRIIMNMVGAIKGFAERIRKAGILLPLLEWCENSKNSSLQSIGRNALAIIDPSLCVTIEG